MTMVSKSVSGFIYQETFNQVSLLWNTLPINRTISLDNSVGLIHGNERVTMTIPAPSGDYVFQASIDHKPTILSDIGGIVVLSTTGNQIECQTYFDNTIGVSQYFQYVKVVKVGDVFTFYASMDSSVWYMIGNSELQDANRIGFFLDGPNTSDANTFVIKNISFYKSNISVFNSIFDPSSISLIDSNGVEHKDSITLKLSDGSMYVDLTNISLPIEDATLKIYNSNNDIIVENNSFNLCGGDVFEYAIKLKFLLDGTEISTSQLADIGRLASEENEYTLTVINNDNISLSGATLSVLAYSDYFRGGSFAFVGLQEDSNGIQRFSNNLLLPDIIAGSSLDVTIKVIRDTDNAGSFFTDQYRFKILLQ